jgi:hypothetical protein
MKLCRRLTKPRNKIIRTPEDLRSMLEESGMIVIQHDCGNGVYFFENVPDASFDNILKKIS